MSNRQYSDETKAAVMAALLAGQSINAVAREFKIPKGTVSGWKVKSERVVGSATQKSAEVGEKLILLLVTELDSLIETSKVARDPTWIKKQNAADLAVFLGVKHDKVGRMLEALGKQDATDDTTTNS
jgi:transposase-like protein